MPSADFWQMIKDSHESLSPALRTPARPPGVSSPAFSAQPLDLQPEPLMDMGLSVNCPLARLGMPLIQFLFVGSRLCSALLSDTLLRDRCPCASLRLHLHHVGEGTFTPELVNMPSTQSTTPTIGGGLQRPYKGLHYLKSLPWFSSLSNLSWLRMYSLITSSFLPTVLT